MTQNDLPSDTSTAPDLSFDPAHDEFFPDNLPLLQAAQSLCACMPDPIREKADMNILVNMLFNSLSTENHYGTYDTEIFLMLQARVLDAAFNNILVASKPGADVNLERFELALTTQRQSHRTIETLKKYKECQLQRSARENRDERNSQMKLKKQKDAF